MSKRIALALLVPILGLALLVSVVLLRPQGSRQITGIVRAADTRAALQGVTLAGADAATTTNGDGEYVLPWSRPSRVLTATLDGYLPVERELTTADRASGSLTLDWDLAPRYAGGYLLDAETNQVLPGVAFQAGDRTVTTNAQGGFQVRALQDGTPVTATVAGYQPATLVFAGQNPFNIFLVPTTAVVTVFNAAGEPVANVPVQAGNAASTTDAGGRAVLRRVNPGVTIHTAGRGFEAASAVWTGGEIRLVLRISSVEGTVTDAATGKPISGTIVSLGPAAYATNAQGAYRVESLPPTATLTVRAPGYRKTQVPVPATGRLDVKLDPFQVKGIHVLFGSTPEHLQRNFDLAAKTEVNALVVDVKAEKGRVGWASQVPLAQQIGAPYTKGIDLRALIERCRAGHLYCIARLPVFQDTLLATARPDLAFRFPNGTPYTDSNGSGWTHAGNAEVWDYNIALAKEAATLGFDEIQFDYVRFPGEVTGIYTGTLATQEGRSAVIAGFLARAQKELRPLGVFVSADVFGLTTATEDDQHTGQRLRDLGPYVDYLSPMVYPDVWSNAAYLLSKGLGIANCTEAVRCPYDVIFNSYKRSTEKTSTRIRPWLQAYVGRGNFGIAEYKLQKKAAEDAGSPGWMFWSGLGEYDAKIFNPKQ